MDEPHVTKPKRTSSTRRQMLKVLKHCEGGFHGSCGETVCFDSEGTYGSTAYYGEGEDITTLSQEDVAWAEKVIAEHGWDSRDATDGDLDAFSGDNDDGCDRAQILRMVLQGCRAGVGYVNDDGSWEEYDDLMWIALHGVGVMQKWDDMSDEELKDFYDDVVRREQGLPGTCGTGQTK